MVRFRWLVLVLTLGVVAIGATWGGGVFNDLISGGFDDPGSQSSRAREAITAQVGPQEVDIVAVYTAPDPALAAQAVAARLEGRAEVATVQSGPPSHDGRSVYLAIQLRDGAEDAKLADLEAIRPLLAADPPATTQIGGLMPFLDDANKQISEDITKAELISLPILLILLIFIFRGVVAALTPLLVGILAVLGAFTTVRLLAQVTDVSVFAINIITMLGLGMAIDYSLFIVSRFREELANGLSTSDAVVASLARAGRTVLVSGLTVALALASLLVFPMDFLKSMAWGGMSAVLVAMVAALTALPALLAVLGPRVNSLRVRLPRAARPVEVHALSGVQSNQDSGGWAKLARSVMRRPVIYAVGVTALLLALATPFLRLELGGFDERVLPDGTESREVSERLVKDFPGGGYPITVLVNGPVGDLPQRIDGLDGATGVRVTAQRGDATLLWVSYAGEATGEAARELVGDIRSLEAPAGTQMMVGGRSAADVDQIQAFGDRLPWMLLLIAASTFVLLFLAFGSVVLPLKAILMNVISIGASFGVVVWVFQDGHLADWLGVTVTGFLEPSNLVLMLAILFGLATDYEVFLLSRVREEWDAKRDNTHAVALGLQRTGGIITAAALLLIIVVAGFATGGTATIKLLGVGTVVAIAVDAALVRTLLVPATMRLLGKWNWWAPRPLAWTYQRFGIRES
ncbi:MMPL family transporter [Allorhizocola rhizosphaerae]|uniref:MMPL family transporter n=1 Tax=Allorhizocola rhizosphaerae TaxID=1872709 RepID=UPI001FEC613E|nr:MMPL family transporter [Allorhizocola rhizosphaerae]